MKQEKLLTSKEAAAVVGLSHVHFRRLLTAGVVEGQKLGERWFVSPRILASFKRYQHNRRKVHGTGRE